MEVSTDAAARNHGRAVVCRSAAPAQTNRQNRTSALGHVGPVAIVAFGGQFPLAPERGRFLQPGQNSTNSTRPSGGCRFHFWSLTNAIRPMS